MTQNVDARFVAVDAELEAIEASFAAVSARFDAGEGSMKELAAQQLLLTRYLKNQCARDGIRLDDHDAALEVLDHRVTHLEAEPAK